MRALALLPLLAAFVLPRQDTAPGPVKLGGRGYLAVKAGTIHLVEEGRVLEHGTLLIQEGRIQAVGIDVQVPADAEIVDYGPDAVIVPGLVAAYSSYALGLPADRTADASLSALEGFDPYHVYADALSGGVTTAYLAPAENRLLAGMGALVKLGGEKEDRRVLNPAAALHGAIDASARNTPGYWEPPVPATVDVGLGHAESQLPRTTMGAIVALSELVDGAAKPDDPAFQALYGKRVAADLARALQAKVPLRLSAVEENEIRGLLSFARERRLPLILDRAEAARGLAAEIAAAGAPVVYRVPYWPNSQAADRGKDEDDRWPSFDVPAALLRAGARVAIAGPSPRDLLFTAQLASRGGLDPEAALRAITLTPAEIFGGAVRVGSLREGKDADLCVLNGPPLASGTSVIATWIDGQVVWKAGRENATVLEVDELFVGDGRVLRPGQILIQEGRIVEVAERVSHPRGALVVHGKTAMPGMIDAHGHLGLEGARKGVGPDFELASLVEPGDEVDRRVALHGITTVVLTPRGTNEGGVPLMAYKPAAGEFERQVVGDPVAVKLRWEDSNRLKSGTNVRELLEKAREYREKWIEYERALAAWKPPKERPAQPAAGKEDQEKKDEKKDEAQEEEKKGEEPKADEKAEEKADDKKEEKKEDKGSRSKKKKKDEPQELEPDPVTGLWQSEIVHPAGAPASTLKLRLALATPGQSDKVEGNLRCAAVSETLVEVSGWFDREKRSLALDGLGSRGWIALAAELKEEKLAGKLTFAAAGVEVSLERLSKEYVVARRKERRAEKEKEPAEPKGKPKEPRRDPKLEPLRAAMDGKGALVIEVERELDILACVETCASYGIRPILFGARDAHLVASRIAGRVAGVMPSPIVVETDPKRGTDYRTPYSELQNAGIRVALPSEAEEGAIDLPLRAAFAVANGLSPEGALRALTADAAEMLVMQGRVGRLERGLDADVLLLDGAPLDPATSVLRAWVNGREIEAP